MNLLNFRATVVAVLAGLGSLVVNPITAHADPTTDASPSTPTAQATQILPVHAERNSIPMMITGIGLLTLGVVATGIGTGALIEGKLECQDALPSINQCITGSPAVNGGIAAIIGGSTFSVIGLGLTIAGAWKVTVPQRVETSASALSLKVGPSSLAFVGSF